MTQFSQTLQPEIDHFRSRVFTDQIGVVDPKGKVHHEFASGNHGRKSDYDKVESGSDLYIAAVAVSTRAILELYSPTLPDVIVGTANGANRFAIDIAHLLRRQGVIGLSTVKIDARTVMLNDDALAEIRRGGVDFALVFDDVGSTGGTTATGVDDLLGQGVPRVEVLNIHQRNPTLPALDERHITYNAVFEDDSLPMYTPEGCRTLREGYCYQGVELIRHVT